MIRALWLLSSLYLLRLRFVSVIVVTIAVTTSVTTITTVDAAFSTVTKLLSSSSSSSYSTIATTITSKPVLLSDIKTPCLLFDNDIIMKLFHMQQQQKHQPKQEQEQRKENNKSNIIIPCLKFHNDWILIPQDLDRQEQQQKSIENIPALPSKDDDDNDDNDDDTMQQQTNTNLLDLRNDEVTINENRLCKFLYIHCQIIQRYDKPFQLQTNIPSIPFVSNNNDNDMLELVLGLNNHHVISYYWARSAGSGSSMIAPGIRYNDINQCLYFANDDDDQNCNNSQTNDGKRSEWVQFLQINDTIQCMPCNYNIQKQLFDYFIQQQGDHMNKNAMSSNNNIISDQSKETAIVNQEQKPSSLRLFGISRQNRPMGSESKIMNEWILQSDTT